MIVGGPFDDQLRRRIASRVTGPNPKLIDDMLSKQHSSAPRFHFGIHLRAEFPSFERSVDRDGIERASLAYEVSTFTVSPRCDRIYRTIRDFVIKEGNITKDSNTTSMKDISVFLAADDDTVKKHFSNRLSTDAALVPHIRIYTLNMTSSGGARHSVTLGREKGPTAHKSMEDLAFEWYFLSLCEKIVVWRNCSLMTSTFSYTAAFMLERDYGNVNPYFYIDNKDTFDEKEISVSQR
jgi:hypothetical protein